MDNIAGNSSFALEQLRSLIRSNRIEDDGKLPTERALSETLGVGRRAVRRALEVLEAEGLIWRRQGSGTYVGQRPGQWSSDIEALVAGTNFLEVMEVRLRIEPQLAQLAAVRATQGDIERLYELNAKIAGGTDADSHELWDGALHRQIAQCAGNHFFLAIFDMINRVRQDESWQAIRELARNANHTQAVVDRQHAAIVDAIASRDPVRAGEAMRQHLLTLQESLTRLTSLDHSQEEEREVPA